MLTQISSLIAKTFILYCQITPNHRGRHRISKILDGIFGSFIVRSPLGQLLEIYLSSSMDLSFLTREGIESHGKTLESLRSLKEGDIFIDIGANIGFFSLFASQLVGESGRILAFEPSHREFIRFLSNIKHNSAKNILPYNIALSDRMGESKLYIYSNSHTGINSLKRSDCQNLSYSLVPTASGESLLMPFLPKHSSCMIKIDVEGAEFLVLSGIRQCLLSESVKYVVVEITPKFLAEFGHTKDDIYNLMTEIGFSPALNSQDWQYDEVFLR